MYCHSCGALATPGLNYCKHCGTNLGPSLGQTDVTGPQPKLHSMIWAISAFGIFSVGALFSALIAMTALRAAGDLVGMTAFMGSLMIFGITALMIRLMTKLAGIPLKGFRFPVLPKSAGTNEFEPPRLAPPAIPGASVTENTTRTFQQRGYKESAQ